MNIKFFACVFMVSFALSSHAMESNTQAADYNVQQIKFLLSTGTKVHELVSRGCNKNRLTEALRSEGKGLLTPRSNTGFQGLEVIHRAPAREEAPFIGQKKRIITTRNVSLVAGIAATVWAAFAARQVAKNVPQQEWNKLSALEKCKLVVSKTLPENEKPSTARGSIFKKSFKIS
jgi:hypothetical protein